MGILSKMFGGGVPSIGAAEAAKAARDGSAVLVDVRERREVAAGVARGARWFAMSRMGDGAEWKRFTESLPRDKTIILYCAAGVRSGSVGSALAKEGFTVANLGGLRDWTSAGLPLDPAPGA